MPSQQQSSMTPVEARDAWRTPRYVFDYLNRIYQFDIDLAADSENALCDLFYGDREDDFENLDKLDALTCDWHADGNIGWCNPPYSQQRAFISKAIFEALHGFTTVMLLPCFNGQGYWQGVFDFGHVTQIIGRLSFMSPCDYEKGGKLIRKGDPVPGNNTGSCLVQFGGERRLPEYLIRDELK